MGDGVKIEPAKPEPDHDFEPLSVAKTTSCLIASTFELIPSLRALVIRWLR